MKTISQKEKILKLLRDNPAGINSYGVARDLSLQLPARVWDLKQAGYQITSINKSDGSVDYVLQGQPEREKKRVGFKIEGDRAIPIYE